MQQAKTEEVITADTERRPPVKPGVEEPASEDLVTAICAARTAEELPPEPETNCTDWMIYRVHQVAIDDPTLTVMNFDKMPMPPNEVRIGAKLARALRTNTTVRSLQLGGC